MKTSGAPTGCRRKLIFGGGDLPRRQKSTKERPLYDSRLAFTPKLKRTHDKGVHFMPGAVIPPHRVCEKGETHLSLNTGLFFRHLGAE
jgi:hypothetical protein